MGFSVDLYHRGATEPYYTLKRLTHNEQLMGEDYVTVSLDSPTVKDPVDMVDATIPAGKKREFFMVGDWLMYRGVKYVVDVPPTLQKQARVRSVGNAVRFDQVKLVNELCHVFAYVDFRDVVNGEEHYNFAARQFSFYCVDLCTLAERVKANLDRDYPGKFRIYVHGKSGGVGYNYLIGGAVAKPNDFEAAGKKNLVVSISDCKLWDGLAHVKDDFDVNFVVRNDANGVMSIFLGANGDLLADQHFAYGKGNGLFKIERVTDNSQAIITKLRAYGAETNMPTRYYRNVGLLYFANVTSVEGTESLGTVVKIDIYPSSLTRNLGKWDSEKASESRANLLEAVSGYDDANVNAYFNNVIDYHYLNGATYYYAKAKVDGAECGVLVASLGGVMYFLVPDATGATKRYSGFTSKKVYFTYGFSKNGWPSGHTEVNQECKLPNNMNVKCLMLPGFGFYKLKEKVKEAFTNKKAGTINVLKEYYDEGKTNNGFDALCEVYQFSEDPTDPWVAKKAQFEAYGCREGQEVFDDSNEDYDAIYPSLQYVGDGTNKLPAQCFTAGGKEYSNSLPNDGGVCDDLVLAGKEIAQWHLFVKDPGFDPYEQRPDGESQITVAFKDGMVGGREFKCVGSRKITKDDGTAVYMLTMDRLPDDTLDLYFPYEAVNSAENAQNTGAAGVASFVPKMGDEIVYLGIEMPSEYVEDAALRQLLPAAMETLDKNCDAQYKYNLTVDEVQMARQHDYAMTHSGVDSMHDTMRAGDVLIFGDEDLGVKEESFGDGDDTINAAVLIDSVEITENEGALPKYTVNLVQQKQLNSIQKIQKQIDSIVSGATSVTTTGGGGGGYSAAEIQKMIRTYGNRWYLSKEEDDITEGSLGIRKNLVVSGNATVAGVLHVTKLTADSVEVMEAKHIAGKVISSAAGCVVKSVETVDDGWKLSFEKKDSEGRVVNNMFMEGDLAYCEQFTVEDNEYVTSKVWWRKIVEVGANDDANYIVVSSTDCSTQFVDTPAAGDNVIVLGSTAVGADGEVMEERQGASIQSPVGTFAYNGNVYPAPYECQYKGISTYTLPDPVNVKSPKLTLVKADKILLSSGKDINDEMADGFNISRVNWSAATYDDDVNGKVKAQEEYASDDVLPSSAWTSATDKAAHLGDFIITANGYSYRYVMDGGDGYVWQWVEDAVMDSILYSQKDAVRQVSEFMSEENYAAMWSQVWDSNGDTLLTEAGVVTSTTFDEEANEWFSSVTISADRIDMSAGTLDISSLSFNLTSENMSIRTTPFSLYKNSDGDELLKINTDNFSIDEEGNVSMNGNVEATSGKFYGSLYSVFVSSYRMDSDTVNLSAGDKFKVDANTYKFVLPSDVSNNGRRITICVNYMETRTTIQPAEISVTSGKIYGVPCYTDEESGEYHLFPTKITVVGGVIELLAVSNGEYCEWYIVSDITTIQFLTVTHGEHTIGYTFGK